MDLTTKIAEALKISDQLDAFPGREAEKVLVARKAALLASMSPAESRYFTKLRELARIIGCIDAETTVDVGPDFQRGDVAFYTHPAGAGIGVE